jgi:hypothetical protein
MKLYLPWYFCLLLGTKITNYLNRSKKPVNSYNDLNFFSLSPSPNFQQTSCSSLPVRTSILPSLHYQQYQPRTLHSSGYCHYRFFSPGPQPLTQHTVPYPLQRPAGPVIHRTHPLYAVQSAFLAPSGAQNANSHDQMPPSTH